MDLSSAIWTNATVAASWSSWQLKWRTSCKREPNKGQWIDTTAISIMAFTLSTIGTKISYAGNYALWLNHGVYDSMGSYLSQVRQELFLNYIKGAISSGELGQLACKFPPSQRPYQPPVPHEIAEYSVIFITYNCIQLISQLPFPVRCNLPTLLSPPISRAPLHHCIT